MRGEKRLSKGLTFISTFTWSKAISDASGFASGESNGTGNRIQDMFNKKADKGLADLDHRYRGVLLPGNFGVQQGALVVEFMPRDGGHLVAPSEGDRVDMVGLAPL